VQRKFRPLHHGRGDSHIRPNDVPLFIIAQIAGGIAATFLFRWLIPSLPARAKDIVLPHNNES
jgi:glycerol uptake facilitator-like aquaporin